MVLYPAHYAMPRRSPCLIYSSSALSLDSFGVFLLVSLNIESFHSVDSFRWVQILLDPIQFLGLEASQVHNFQLFPVLVMGSIWMARNRLVHDNSRVAPFSLQQKNLKCFRENVAAWAKLPVLRQPISSSCFQPGRYHHMSFDVAVHSSFSMVAAVLFSSNGDILKAWTLRSLDVDPLVGEAEAALLALSKAREVNISSLLLAGDSLLVVDCLRSLFSGVFQIPWKISFLICNAVELFRSLSFSWFSSFKISRADNFAAHSVAIWAAALSHESEVPSSFLLNRGIWKYNGAKSPYFVFLFFLSTVAGLL